MLLWFSPGFDKEREIDFHYFFSRNIRENFSASPPPLSLSLYIYVPAFPSFPHRRRFSREADGREREREILGGCVLPPPPPPFSGLHPVCPHSLSRSRHGRFCSAPVYTPSSKEEVLQTLPFSAQYLVRRKKEENSLSKEALTLPFYGTLQSTTFSARKI